MYNNIVLKNVTEEVELLQIIDLQTVNHVSNVSKDIAVSQGYVTVRHTFDLLRSMNDAAPQIIAKDNQKVVGYALVMLPSFADKIPVLIPMFRLFEDIIYNGKKITDWNYYVMGQICVAEDYRGQQIFDKLYAQHRTTYAQKYDFCVTEVAVGNTRSMRAHERVGFKIAHTYKDETDTWNVLIWDFS
jgi:ribosomal protein S18 acetylase RimI-like enzyme